MKKIGKSRKKILFFMPIFFAFIIIVIYYFSIVLPIVKTYSKAEIKSITEKAVNIAVSNVVNRTLSYDSLIDISYTANGEIASFSANQYEINTITREIIKETQFQMNNIVDDLKINIGTFSGLPFLIGKGHKVGLKLMPIGAVSGKFDSVFDAVGINMTKHSLFLYVDVHVTVVLPVKAYEVFSSNQVLLAESIIVGKVPEFYFNGGLNKSLNLVP